MRTLVLYVFHIINDRVQHFIKNAVFYDKFVDFIFIANDTNLKRSDIKLPDYCKFISRENIGYDFGGWSEALLINNLYLNYTHFIFANSSIIGPFLQPDFKGNWTDIYLNGLQGNIKLFGSTINSICDPLFKSHVQSYIFSMDLKTLKYLISCEIFSLTNYAINFNEAIDKKEILMSRKIIDKDWNIGCLMKYYKGVDFTFKGCSVFDCNYFIGDIMCEQYKNILWNKYELVFVKGNRFLNI
jgi:hypothetical protein